MTSPSLRLGPDLYSSVVSTLVTVGENDLPYGQDQLLDRAANVSSMAYPRESDSHALGGERLAFQAPDPPIRSATDRAIAALKTLARQAAAQRAPRSQTDSDGSSASRAGRAPRADFLRPTAAAFALARDDRSADDTVERAPRHHARPAARAGPNAVATGPRLRRAHGMVQRLKPAGIAPAAPGQALDPRAARRRHRRGRLGTGAPIESSASQRRRARRRRSGGAPCGAASSRAPAAANLAAPFRRLRRVGGRLRLAMEPRARRVPRRGTFLRLTGTTAAASDMPHTCRAGDAYRHTLRISLAVALAAFRSCARRGGAYLPFSVPQVRPGRVLS